MSIKSVIAKLLVEHASPLVPARILNKDIDKCHQAILAEFERMLPEEKNDYGVIPKEISYNQAVQEMKAKLEKE